jgi:DNA-binding transcriptional LysR family regulator
MEWRQILSFYRTAKLGSFTKAADTVFRSQSALSQQIRALEDELGCVLLERVGRRKVILTECGRELFGFAETVLNEERRLMERLDEVKGMHRGPVVVAAPFTTLYHLFPERLQRFMKRFPDVRLTILDRPQDTVIRLVREGEVDFGVAAESLVPDDLELFPWMTVRTVLMTPEDHPLAGRSRVSLQEIAEYPLILPPSQPHSRRTLIERLCRQEGIAFRMVMESSNADLSAVYVEMGLGISFAGIVPGLPSLERLPLSFVPLDHYFEPEHLAIITRRTMPMTSVKSEFLRCITEDH